MTMQYVTGGTMLAWSVSYVVRDADRILRDQLLQGEFCYVLTPRQMGKSSLMIRTAAALRERGVATAILDLSKQGYTPTLRQWYNGLLETLAEGLDLEAEMEAFCRTQVDLSPLQVWDRALRRVILEQKPGQVVIFVDEIDITRRLSFETDEFFAAIRACHNARAHDPAYQRLTFCLLGVAIPSDLIRDPLLTPFNIGTRIDLRDFTPQEADSLQAGLGHDAQTNRALMERIYHWTQGHPYLTQRLCKAVAEQPAALTADGVDRCCRDLFLDPRSHLSDDNLIFVRQRLVLDDESQRAELLTRYQQILAGTPVYDSETDACVSALKLSGAVRAANGLLVTRNPIYRAVFNRAWTLNQMPDAERRRQRAAYRKGVLRAAAVVIPFLVSVGLLIFFVQNLRYQAAKERYRAIAALEKVRDQYIYASAINLAQQAWNEGNVGRTEDLVETKCPPELRGFEWRYLHRLLHLGLHIFRGHQGIVWSVAFSPDGNTLASGGRDHTIRLWDLTARHDPVTLAGHTSHVSAVVFSRDGSTLVSASWDKTIKLWNARTGTLRQTLTGHRSAIFAIALSPNGKLLASSSDDGEVKLWDLASRRDLTTQTGHTAVSCVSFAPDGQRLAFSGDDYTIKLLDIASHRIVKTLRGHTNGIRTLAFSPDGRLLASGSDDETIKLWDVASGRPQATLKGHVNIISSLAFTHNGRMLASGSWDNTIKLWDLRRQVLLQTIRGHADMVDAVAFAPNDSMLASGGNDATVRLWPIPCRPELPTLTGHSKTVFEVAFSPNGKLLATATGDRTIRLWDVAARRVLKTLKGHATMVSHVVFSPDGKMLVSGDSDNMVKLWEVATARCLTSIPVKYRGRPIRFSPDGRLLAFTSAHTKIQIRDVNTGRMRAELVYSPRYNIHALAFSPDGKRLAVSGDDAKIRLWEVASGRQIATLSGHTHDVLCLAFSPDGHFLASGAWDRIIKLWNMRTQSLIATLHGHMHAVDSLAFSHDGRTLASGAEDGTVKLWHVATGQEMLTLGLPPYTHPDTGGTSLAFSPDDRILAANGHGETVRLWEGD